MFRFYHCSIGASDSAEEKFSASLAIHSGTSRLRMPFTTSTKAPRYAPLSEADLKYHFAACLRDSIQWAYKRIKTKSRSHLISETLSSSLPTQFRELHCRVRRAYLLRRTVERAEASTGQTPLLRRAVASRRRAELLALKKDRSRNFVWNKRMDRIFDEVLADQTLRKSPYAVLAEMRLRGVNEKELTTAKMKGVIRWKRSSQKKLTHKRRDQSQSASETLGAEKRTQTRAEKIRAMLPNICREPPTAHLGDELMYFDSELRI